MGIGGIVGAYGQYFFQHRKEIRSSEHDYKRQRYLCLMILMLTQLNPKVGLSKAKQFRSDLATIGDVQEEIKTEFFNCFIYANDDVINSLLAFIFNPSHNSFVRVAKAMRGDLWGTKSNISENIFQVLNK